MVLPNKLASPCIIQGEVLVLYISGITIYPHLISNLNSYKFCFFFHKKQPTLKRFHLHTLKPHYLSFFRLPPLPILNCYSANKSSKPFTNFHTILKQSMKTCPKKVIRISFTSKLNIHILFSSINFFDYFCKLKRDFYNQAKTDLFDAQRNLLFTQKLCYFAFQVF